MQMGQQPLMLFGATPAHSSTTFNPPGQLPRPDDPRSRTSKTETEGQRSSQSSPPSNQGAGSGSQRSIDTTFQVNPTNGTASLSVPLPVTAGRGSLTPDLNLCYDSGFGNGLFGLGWQIPFDTVTRKTSNSIPRYDTTSPTEDTYILFNVDELVPSGELAVIDHWLVQKFRPRLETQPGKIERWTSCKDATDVHWRAISGDNQTTLFGLDDSSRVSNTDANGSKCIFSWLCCYAYDAYGNAMQYEYKGENSNDVLQCYEGQYDTARSTPSKHIKRIRYGNRTPNRDLQSWKPHHALKTQHWLFEVVFDYGEHDYNAPQPSEIRPWELRLDCFSNYRAGYEIRTQRICKRILVFHHMPEKLDGAHICVSSAELQFHEAETGSLLERVIVRGLGAEGKTETLPVQRFGYHRKPAIETVQLQVADIPGLRTGSDLNTLGQWVDLESEGAPGLLHVCPEGAWTYRRNANGVLCSGNMLLQCTSETLPSHPSVGLVSESYYLEDLDRNGSLDLVALNKSRCPYGYQERVSGKWEVFQSFTKVPSFELDHSLTRRIDVTGSGLSDIVTIDENTNEVIWYENLGKEGFGQERRVPRRDNRLSFGSNDPTVMITLADMSGDELQDVVRVANGRISYFSNLGYGCFSSERVMSCSPVFDRDDTFTFKRIMLVDLDGSGLSDVVYLPPQGGLHVYRNLCGNGWGPRQLNSNFPAIDNLSTVFPLDLFGNGTICLCWVGDDFQSSAACPLFYIDFHMGNKPCLLEWVENGMGKKTTFSYRPSTWFYRQDEVHGTPWKSKVPFPIHCVELMTVEDRIRQTSVRRRYAYHDGFYDGVESQFRGFGMVEQWDCEDFRGLQGFKRPPVLTKSWFAVGDHIPGHKLPRAFSENVLKWQNLPQYGSRAEEADVVRATKGIKLREEIYGIDGSARQDLPYSVTEYSHEIQQRQSLTGTQFGVYSIITKEQMTYAYERIKTNPRIEHSLVLQVNEFGLALKTAAISYGVPSSGLDDPVNRARQEETFITYSETIYTECVDTRHSYRSPLISQTKSYAVVGALKGQRFATIEDLTNDNFAFISKLPLIPLSQASLIHRKTPFKSLTSESVTTFRSQNLSKILHQEKLEEYAIPEQTFRLAIDSQMLDETCPSFYQPDDVMISRSGYVDLHGDGNLWQASARARFGEGPDELTCARRTFYEPSIVVDTFGNKMRTEFDDYILMVTKATDALGNTTETEYDYRTMNMVNMTDPNGNHTGFLYDALGRQIASAMSGKAGEEVGDTLAGVDLDPDYGRLEAFLHNPRDEYGRNLLGKSSNRTIYIHKHTEEAEVAGVFGPSCQVSLSRTRNASEDPDLKVGEIQVEVVYFDGSSQPVQIAHLYSVEEKTPTWRFSGWETLDNKGALVKTHQPSFRETPAFNFECNVNSPATINLRDPLGRAVAVFYPNHAWEKTTFTPWSRMVYDEGDLIDVSDPRSDSEVGDLFKVLDPKYFMPSWLDCKLSASNKDKWERDAAQKSKAYANHPDSHHFNALGQTIYTVVDDGGRKLSKTLQYDVAGNVCSSSDAMGRGVECISYDYLGRSLKKMQMDAGESWVILDCNGKSLVEGNNAGYIVEHIYDELQRRTQTFLRRAGGFKALITNIIYGENLPDSKSRNQRQQIVCVQDQSGVVNYEAFDFRATAPIHCVNLPKIIGLW